MMLRVEEKSLYLFHVTVGTDITRVMDSEGYETRSQFLYKGSPLVPIYLLYLIKPLKTKYRSY